ncbi:MAG: 50S ribosomal protein L11 methyltransferase [Leptolyngbyaceae bacterium]|nr:50S ribosomal protein L11 methyltransferase [Leptolyngbyaceae bacterium]
MPWMELSLNTTHEAVDWVCTLLATTDYGGEVRVLEYADLKSSPLAEPEQGHPAWTFTISLYLPCDRPIHTQVEKLEHLLSPLHRTGIATALQVSRVDEKPAPRSGLNPLAHRIGQRFVVLTPDALYEPESVDDIPLRLKTSLSFGSGLHPATIVSLRLLERYITPTMNVLDLGSGSGILSVAMAKLGAQVLALDNDRVAVEATQDAVDRNRVAQQVTVRAGSLGQGSDLGHWMGGDVPDQVPTTHATGSFDLIVSNILARVHIALAPDLQRALRRTDGGGLLITAGFTTDQEGDVDAALREVGFQAIACERLNEWVALAHRLV